jgi:hypothetical protein
VTRVDELHRRRSVAYLDERERMRLAIAHAARVRDEKTAILASRRRPRLSR